MLCKKPPCIKNLSIPELKVALDACVFYPKASLSEEFTKYMSECAKLTLARINELEADKLRKALAHKTDRLPPENPQPLEQVKIRKW